jgi:hypothetical protein
LPAIRPDRRWMIETAYLRDLLVIQRQHAPGRSLGRLDHRSRIIGLTSECPSGRNSYLSNSIGTAVASLEGVSLPVSDLETCITDSQKFPTDVKIVTQYMNYSTLGCCPWKICGHELAKT